MANLIYGRCTLSVIAVFVLVLGLNASAYPQSPLPPAAANTPDLQVLVFSGDGSGQDSLVLTYGDVVPQTQVVSDLADLNEQLHISVAQAKVTNSALPMPGIQTPAMTSISVPAPGALPLTGGALPVASLIVALRQYRRIEMTFIMPPNYVYSGVRNYSDKNLSLAMVQSGATYTFNVTIANSDFSTIVLPSSVVMGTARYPGEPTPLLTSTSVVERMLVLVLVFAAAGLIGWGVYATMVRMQQTQSR
jgi:hypothetical protein